MKWKIYVLWEELQFCYEQEPKMNRLETGTWFGDEQRLEQNLTCVIFSLNPPCIVIMLCLITRANSILAQLFSHFHFSANKTIKQAFFLATSSFHRKRKWLPPIHSLFFSSQSIMISPGCWMDKRWNRMFLMQLWLTFMFTTLSGLDSS